MHDAWKTMKMSHACAAPAASFAHHCAAQSSQLQLTALPPHNLVIVIMACHCCTDCAAALWRLLSSSSLFVIIIIIVLLSFDHHHHYIVLHVVIIIAGTHTLRTAHVVWHSQFCIHQEPNGNLMRSFDDANAMQGNFPNFAQARNQMETWRSFYDAIGVQGNFPNFAQARNQIKNLKKFLRRKCNARKLTNFARQKWKLGKNHTTRECVLAGSWNFHNFASPNGNFKKLRQRECLQRKLS